MLHAPKLVELRRVPRCRTTHPPFYYGNLRLRHAGLIALLSFPYQLSQTGLDASKVRELVRRLRAAYRRGKRSRDLLAVRFDEMWDRPVAEIAREVCEPRAN